jgi:hypothetical protein
VPLDGGNVVTGVDARRILVVLLSRMFLRGLRTTRVELTESQGLAQKDLVPDLVLIVAVRLGQHPLATLRRKLRRKRMSMRPRAQARTARFTACFSAENFVAPLFKNAAARPRAYPPPFSDEN